MGLTMLSRFFQTSQKIQLYFNILRPLRKLNFVPTLGRCPPAGLSVPKNLLIDVQDMKMGRDTFNAIGLVYLGVYVLKTLQLCSAGGRTGWLTFVLFSLISDVLLPIEQ